MYKFLVRMNLPLDMKPSVVASKIGQAIMKDGLSDKVHVLPMGDEDVSSIHVNLTSRLQKGGARKTSE